jgi:hypothetical protein
VQRESLNPRMGDADTYGSLVNEQPCVIITVLPFHRTNFCSLFISQTAGGENSYERTGYFGELKEWRIIFHLE